MAITTTLQDVSLGIRDVGGRTNFAGSAVTDLSAEEDRYAHIALSEGAISPTDSFQVVAGAGATMNVVVGSGAAKTDYFLVPGIATGQGNYIVRLEASTETFELTAADGSNARIDEVYIIVQDDIYDSSSRSLPVLAIRKSDPAPAPVAPGPDSSWDAYTLLATIDIPAAAADIVACTFTDERLNSGIVLGDGVEYSFDANDAIIDIPTGGTVRLRVNDTDVFTISDSSIDAGGSPITNVGNIAGVSVPAHGSRHAPDGDDPVTTAAANTIQPDDTAAIGSALSLSRSDHRHAIVTAAPSSSIEPEAGNTEGSATTFSRSDHMHHLSTGTTNDIAPVKAEGVSTQFSRADHVHKIDDMRSVGMFMGYAATEGPPSLTGSMADLLTTSVVLPSGWSTMEIMAWGEVFVEDTDNSNRSEFRIEIGASNGVSRGTYPGGAVSGEYTFPVTTHSASRTSTSTVAIAGRQTVGTASDIVFAWLRYIAIRVS